MVDNKIKTEELFRLLNDTTAKFFQLVASFGKEEINAKPQAGSWSAAQVAEHVMLSNRDVTIQLLKAGKTCDREPDAGIEKIRSIFLNFDKKLNSPDFILPTKEMYDRQQLISALKRSIFELINAAHQKDLFEIIHHAIFGEITRFETLYFVVYHTQRHIHQLRKIQTATPEQIQ